MNFLKKNPIIVLLLILLLASFFRLWQLDSIPPGLYPDEAINGNDAINTLETGQFKVFYPENNGREGIFIWLITLSFKLFGIAGWSLRLVSAIFGILTVLGLYLMTKELFLRSSKSKNLGFKNYSEKIALLSAFFLSISFWHTNFSRIGFRAILVPFLLCFSFYFLLRAFRKNSALDYIWSGIFFGLGFYTYIAFRVAVLILAVFLLLKIIDYWQKNKPTEINWDWLWKKAYLKDGWWKIDLFLITVLIVVLPICFHFLNNPQDFMGRAGGVSVLGTEQPLKELSFSTIKTLGMFNFAGDWNWRHNYAGSPMLAWSVGILFILGLILTLWSFFTRLFSKKIDIPSIFLLSWFAIMLLPAVLTFEGIPHALRTIGVIPIVCILAAIGLIWFFNQLAKINKKIAILLFILFLIQPTIANFNKYFFKWAKNSHVGGAFRQDLVDLTNYLNNLPDNIQTYVIVNEDGVAVPYPDGLPMPVQTMIFKSKALLTNQEEKSKIKYLVHDSDSQAILKQPLIIVTLKYDEAIFQQFSEKWPNGIIKKINNFNAYEIK